MGSQRVRHDWATELNWTELAGSQANFEEQSWINICQVSRWFWNWLALDTSEHSEESVPLTGLLTQLLQACETPWDTFILLPPFLVLQPLLEENCCTPEVVETSRIILVFLGHRKHWEPIAVHPSWIKGYKWVIWTLYPLPTTQAPQKHCTHGTEEGNENTQWPVRFGQIVAEIKEEIMETLTSMKKHNNLF